MLKMWILAFSILVFSNIAACRNIDKVCLTSKGKYGICLPADDCPGYTMVDHIFAIPEENSCQDDNDTNMVCCYNVKSFQYLLKKLLIPKFTFTDDLKSIIPRKYKPSDLLDLDSFNILKDNLRRFYGGPDLESSSAVTSIDDLSSLEPASRVAESTASPESASIASVAPINNENLVSLSNALSRVVDTTANPISEAVVSAASLSDAISIAPSETLSKASASIDSKVVSAASAAPLSVASLSETLSRVAQTTANPISEAVVSVASLSDAISIAPLETLSKAAASVGSEAVSAASAAPLNEASLLRLSDALSRAAGTTANPVSAAVVSAASLSEASLFSSSNVLASAEASTANPISELVASAASISNKISISSLAALSSFSESLSKASTASSKTASPYMSEASTTNSVISSESESSVASLSTLAPSTSTAKPEDVDYASVFPEPPVCGNSTAMFSRVVNGVNATLGQFPWMGIVAYAVSGGFTFKCGASLITSQHALTAAHCILKQLYFVRLGELDLADHSQSTPVDVVVKTAIKHRDYETKYGTNDIGILVFYRQVKFTDLIRPICLPFSSDLRSNDFVGYNPFVAGWGQTRYKGPAATRLQVLQIPVVSLDVCKAAYEPLKVFLIDKRVICAGGEGGKDACNGDSGGPLMQPIWNPVNFTTYYYQTGIVSFGMMCGTPGYPSVFTRVTEYIPWIREQVLATIS